MGRAAGRPSDLLDGAAQGHRDRRRQEARSRSGARARPRADQRGYYEIRLFREGSLRMERFALDEATRQRRSTPCQLTREVLERLADDIAASVP